MYRLIFPLVLGMLLVLAPGCRQAEADYQQQARNPELLRAALNRLTEVMVYDIFSPPQASRTYAYASIAAYEALVPGHPGQKSLAGQLNGLPPIPWPDTSKAYALPLSSLHAFLTVSEAMVYSEEKMNAFHEDVHARYRAMGLPDTVFERSVRYGNEVAQHILAWCKRDGYDQARSAPRYTVTGEPGRWRPTPPAYMNAIHPNWTMLRPFVMDSSSQFKPPRPLPYSMEEDSPFYEQVMEVYRIGLHLTKEQQEIASFWDCNPYALHTRGHAMFATKKMTPGGHWMAIAAIASRKTEASLMSTAETFAQVAIALADGFISAWDEKYRSDLVRPVTVISQHVDPAWQPLLQTPPFPEYPSAHSVTSAAAATVLTDLYGPSFSFQDSSEVPYGLPVRSFESFLEAAHEAAISRLYGGIHYRMAAKNGFAQGRQLGRWVARHVDTRAAARLAQHRPPRSSR